MKFYIHLLIAVMIVPIGFSSAYAADSDFKAGVASICITPDENIWMAGYASRKQPSDGVAQDIYAKALTLEDSRGKRIVLVTTDLLGITADIGERVTRMAHEKTGLPREAIMLTASHTHCGPVIRKNLESMYNLSPEEMNKVTRYTDQLVEKLVQAILESTANLEAASLYRGNGDAKFAINRRQYTLDNVIIGNNPIGPVDHDVPVMKVVKENGDLLAVVFGYTCHNTTLDIYQICGDYAGFAQSHVEENHPGAVAMFFSGCGGDANPHPRRKLEYAQNHGRELGESVDKVLSQPMLQVQGPVETAYSTIDLPLTKAPSREELQDQLEDENVYIQYRARDLLKVLDEKDSLPETYPYPIQVWNFGNEFMQIALAGEVVVDYSLRLKHELGRENIWVIAYANDVFAYIPSLRVLREGGYEANQSMIYYGLHGPWAPQVEEMIVAEVHRLVKDTKEAPSN